MLEIQKTEIDKKENNSSKKNNDLLINKNVNEQLNTYINKLETLSRTYIYLSLWVLHNGRKGIAKHLETLSNKKEKYAKEVIDYLLDIGIMPEIKSIEIENDEISSLEDVIDIVYNKELKLKNIYNELLKTIRDNEETIFEPLILEHIKDYVEDLSMVNDFKNNKDNNKINNKDTKEQKDE